MPSGIVEFQNRSVASGKFESTIEYFFLILADCSHNAPTNPYRY